jgi:hypothetical protein
MNSTFLALCLNELYFPTTVPSCAHAHWSVIGASGVYGARVAYILYMLTLTVYRLAGGGLLTWALRATGSPKTGLHVPSTNVLTNTVSPGNELPIFFPLLPKRTLFFLATVPK